MTAWAGLKTRHPWEGLLHHITWQTCSPRPQSQPLQDEAMRACVPAGATNCQKLSKTLSIAGAPLASEIIFSMFAPVCCQPKLVLTSSCVSDNPACMAISM